MGGNEGGKRELMENRRKNRGRRKRKEGGLERIAKRDEHGRKKRNGERGNGKMEEIIPPR